MSAMDSFAAEFQAMTLNTKFAPRPDKGGTAGKGIKVLANVYEVKFNPKLDIHHYDVAIKPVEADGRPAKGNQQEVERNIPTKRCREIWHAFCLQESQLAGVLTKAAYDGRKGLFTPVLFPFGTGSKEFVVTLPKESQDRQPPQFRLAITHAQTFSTECIAQWLSRKQGYESYADLVALAIQAFDILLRHDLFFDIKNVPGGRGRKFFNSDDINPIGNGAVVLGGLFQSMRPTAGGLVLNLDTAYSPFLEANSLLNVVFKILGRVDGGGGGGGRGGRAGRGGRGAPDISAPFTESELRRLRETLTGARVVVKHRTDKRQYIIKRFKGSASRETFNRTIGEKSAAPSLERVAAAAAAGAPSLATRPTRQQETISVLNYFASQFNCKLSFPNLSVVEINGGGMVPIECLELLPGTSIPPTRLTPDQAASMIKIAAKKPEDRKKLTDQIRSKVAYEKNGRVTAWGVSPSPTMKLVDARVLPTPKVTYSATGKIKDQNVRSGSWNLVDTKYTIANTTVLKHWGVISFASERDMSLVDIQKFMTTLIAQMKSKGMNVQNDKPIIHPTAQFQGQSDDGSPNYLFAIKKLARDIITTGKVPPQLIVIILKDRAHYHDVKRTVTMALPIAVASQVLMTQNLKSHPRALDQYTANVTMKLNVKLGGANWSLSKNDLPKVSSNTMLIGADVTHPPAIRGSEQPAPSVAGLVAALNADLTEWDSQVRSQTGRVETILEIKDMAVDLFKAWKTKNKGKLPESIIFYRDGVSEGQYAMAVDTEIRAFKEAYKVMDGTGRWIPTLTYVIAAKRHNFRFFANNPADTDKSGNLPAGTVVDTQVTHPYLFDFYLQSQAGLVGTARPCHYIVLLDENKFSSDQFQKLTYSLCYAFQRATRSVSIVPMAYYADILLTKVRSYAYIDDTASISSGNEAVSNSKFIQQQLERKNTKMAGLWFM